MNTFKENQAMAIVSLVAFGSIASILATYMIDFTMATYWDRAILISLLTMGATLPIRFAVGENTFMKVVIVLSTLITLTLLISKAGGVI